MCSSEGFTVSPTQEISPEARAEGTVPPALLDVRQTAALLGVSECWVRRHMKQLPAVRVGHLIRFDSALLLRKFQGSVSGGNRLKPEGKAPMVKRRFQKGMLLKKGKRGQQVWYGVFREDAPNADGGIVRRQRCVRLGTVSEFPNQEDAREQLSALMNIKPSVEMAFPELVQRWTELVVPTLKDSSAALYSYNLKKYVLPVFRAQSVSKIDREDVERFLAYMAKKKYRRNTLRAMKISLGHVLSWAVEHKWIAENPCSGVKVPKTGKKVKRSVLTPDQVKAIVSELGEPYATLVLFLAITGLRVGEAVGIKWSDFDGEFLHVQRRIYERREGTLKTDHSEDGSGDSTRFIPIPFALLERMETLRNGGDWVFQSRNGTPVDPKNAGNRHLRPTVRKLGIALGGWHDFRHTFATQLLKQRHSAKMVSELLGHSDVETTLKTYTHPEREDFRIPLNERAAELLSNVSKSAILHEYAESKMLN